MSQLPFYAKHLLSRNRKTEPVSRCIDNIKISLANVRTTEPLSSKSESISKKANHRLTETITSAIPQII